MRARPAKRTGPARHGRRAAADVRHRRRRPQGWSKFTTGAFSLSRVEGNHLWPLDKEPKGAWLAAIASGLESPASS